MNLQTHIPGASMFSILRKDPIVRLAGLVLVLQRSPLLPGLGPDTRAAWGSSTVPFPAGGLSAGISVPTSSHCRPSRAPLLESVGRWLSRMGSEQPPDAVVDRQEEWTMQGP